MESTNQILLDISEESSKLEQQFEGMLPAEEIEALTAKALEDELEYDRQLEREREKRAEERRREKERQEEIARQVAAEAHRLAEEARVAAETRAHAEVLRVEAAAREEREKLLAEMDATKRLLEKQKEETRGAFGGPDTRNPQH